MGKNEGFKLVEPNSFDSSQAVAAMGDMADGESLEKLLAYADVRPDEGMKAPQFFDIGSESGSEGAEESEESHVVQAGTDFSGCARGQKADVGLEGARSQVLLGDLVTRGVTEKTEKDVPVNADALFCLEGDG